MNLSSLNTLAIKLQEITGCYPSDSSTALNCYEQIARQMQYACEFNSECMLEVIPSYELAEDVRKYIISFILKDSHDAQWPSDLLKAKSILLAADALKAETEQVDVVEPEIVEADTEYDAEKLVLPRLPRILEIFSHHIPEGFEPALIIAMLPALGTLPTDVWFYYRETRKVHTFSFITLLMGTTSGGKSFITDAINLVLKKFKARSDQELKYFNRYMQLEKKHPGQDPEVPKGQPRYLPIRMSQAALLRCLQHAEGKHLFTYEPEIDSLVSNMKRGTFATQTDIYRKAFDNDSIGQVCAGADYITGTAVVKYNLLLAGTPSSCMQFCSASGCENGTSNRIPVAILPSQVGIGAPKIDPYTDEELEEIEHITDNLESATGCITCPAVDEAIYNWEQQKIKEELSTDRTASINQLRKRAAVNGYRAGMLCYLLEKDNASFSSSDIMQFATWVADYTFCIHMKLYSNTIEADAKKQNAILHGKIVAVAKPHRYLDELSQTFSREDLKQVLSKNGVKPNVLARRAATFLNRWKDSKLIKALEGGGYEKIV